MPRTCCDARAQADGSASREAAKGILRAERAPALLNNLPALAREAMAASLSTTPALTTDVQPNSLNLSDVSCNLITPELTLSRRARKLESPSDGPPAASLLIIPTTARSPKKGRLACLSVRQP